MTDGSRDVRKPAQDIALPVYERRYDFLSGCGFRAFGGNEGHGRGFAALRIGRPSEAKREIASTLAQSFALVVILTLILGAVLAPCAFADALVYDDGGRVWGPNIVNSSTPNQPLYGQIIVANNKYNAALFALGYDPNDNDKFTSEVKAKLSNESTGGAFYTFASRIFPVRTFGDIPWQTSNIDFIGLYGTLATLYDVDRIFAVDYDSVMQLAAKISLEAVLNGGGTSGGGSGGATDGYLTFEGNVRFFSGTEWGSYYTDGNDGQRYTASVGLHDYNPTRYNFISDSVQLKVPTSLIESYLEEYPTDEYDYIALIRCTSGKLTLEVYIAAEASSTGQNSVVNANTYISGIQTKAPHIRLNFVTGATNYSFDGSVMTYSGSLGSVVTGSLSVTGSTPYTFLTLKETAPVIPSTNWPDPPEEPVVPDPPEVPDVPDEQPITQPNPTNPTVPQQPTDVVGGTPPQYDPVTYPTEQTHTADLQGILDAMAEHCLHLQAAIHTMGDDLGSYLGTIFTQQVSRLHDMVYENLGWIGGLITSEGQSMRTSIYGNIGWLGDTMVDEFGALKDYLQQLFTWLGEQLNYEVNVSQDSYDDSSVLYWLKRIWSKMGDGISTRPVDPVVDPIGTGDWLGTIWDNLLTALRDLGINLLDDIGDSLETLAGKFPFSVPFDIAAMLALLAADPVVPVFEVPCYALSGNELVEVGSYELDLTPYDAALAGVRFMEKLAFVFLLAYRTKDFMELLEGAVGFD